MPPRRNKRGKQDPHWSEWVEGEMPKKAHFRSRAHCNPLANNTGFAYPVRPAAMDWAALFPGEAVAAEAPVANLDVGMGFGGLTVALARLFPAERTLGLEIRPKVTEYVRLRLEALRKEHPGQYRNAAALLSNAMRHLPNFFPRGSVQRLFFCFPDPCFKAKVHRRRIVNTCLLDEYAYLLAPGGRLHTITDVLDLHQWHVAKCDAHPLFRRVPDAEVAEDACVLAMQSETEEGKKVARAGGDKYWAVYERVCPSLDGGGWVWSGGADDGGAAAGAGGGAAAGAGSA